VIRSSLPLDDDLAIAQFNSEYRVGHGRNVSENADPLIVILRGAHTNSARSKKKDTSPNISSSTFFPNRICGSIFSGVRSAIRRHRQARSSTTLAVGVPSTSAMTCAPQASSIAASVCSSVIAQHLI
jgi:hypothetical protein